MEVDGRDQDDILDPYSVDLDQPDRPARRRLFPGPRRPHKRKAEVQIHRQYTDDQLQRLYVRELPRGFPAPSEGHFDFFSKEQKRQAMYKRSKRVAAPVSSTSVVRLDAAKRQITLAGREYFGSIETKDTQFGVMSEILRPTDYKLFSWMAGIAHKFEEYKFSTFTLTYEPQCATNVSGSVGLFYDSDPTHSSPANWNNFINTPASVHGACWSKQVLSVPRHLFAGRKQYYTVQEFVDPQKQGVNPADPLEYFAGRYGYCFEGSSMIGTIGKVYCEYVITLKVASTELYNYLSVGNVLRSGEIALNSGSGLYASQGSNAIPVGTQLGVSGGYIMGSAPVGAVAVAVGDITWAGSQFFSVSANKYLTAVADVELLVSIYCQCDGAHTMSALDYFIDGHEASAVATGTRLLRSYGAYTPSMKATTIINETVSLKLLKGERFQCIATSNAGGTLVGFRCHFAPMIFQIEV